MFGTLHQQYVHTMSSVFRAGVFCPPNKAGVGVVYIALERMQPEEIFQHNELSQVPNEKCLQEVHPIPPAGKSIN